MSESNLPKMVAENRAFMIRSIEHGHLAPVILPSGAPKPSKKPCPNCKAPFKGDGTMCLACRKYLYPNEVCDPDSYLDVCSVCSQKLEQKPDGSPSKTLHLGPGWCVMCNGVPGNDFPVFCGECELVEYLPTMVKSDREGGEEVDMLAIKTLWCVKCEGEAASYCSYG